MSEQQQRLDTSLTSMDWLSRLNTNKQLLDNRGTFNSNNATNCFNFFPNSSNSNSSDGCFNPSKPTSDVDPTLIDKLTFSSLENKSPSSSTTSPPSTPSKKQGRQKDSKKSENNSNRNTPITINATSPPTTTVIHSSSAQRAEPHRPIDLNAEYRGNDLGRREGKPPYSYVNLITFAINSTSKKRMTLNEIYQWIAENFHYYRKAGSGWKVKLKQLI